MIVPMLVCAAVILVFIGLFLWVRGWINEQLDNDENGGRYDH